MNSIAAVIMAAGKGTRMKSSHSKVVQKVAGEPMVSHVFRTCKKVGAEKVIAVVGHLKEEVMAAVGEGAIFAHQTELLGTGDAVMRACEFIGDETDYVVILSGDAPLVSEETIESALKFHKDNNFSCTVFTACLDDAAKYGRIIKNEKGELIKIVEFADATDEEKEIHEINGGMYWFSAKDLKFALSKIDNNNAQGEYYLTDTIDVLKNAGKGVGCYTVSNPDEILGVNTKLELCQVDKIMRMKINSRHALNGVYFQNIENTFIGPDVEIEADAEILTGTILAGKTKIGAECVIGPNSRIENSVIGKGSTADNAVILESSVGDGCKIGPFAYIRPGSKIGNGCKVGDFVEIKNASLGDGTKASHLTYVGDSDVGKGVNFGCGTITVNYDGKKKHRSQIGDNAFIGCNTNLVSPVKVGDGAYIAAGSTIVSEVPDKTLAIARARQVIKTNWKDKREED